MKLDALQKFAVALVVAGALFDAATTEVLLRAGSVQTGEYAVSFSEANPLFHVLGEETFIAVYAHYHDPHHSLDSVPSENSPPSNSLPRRADGSHGLRRCPPGSRRQKLPDHPSLSTCVEPISIRGLCRLGIGLSRLFVGSSSMSRTICIGRSSSRSCRVLRAWRYT